MDLVLLAQRTVAAEQVADVVQDFVFHHEMRAADDIDVVLDGHLGEQFQVGLGELRQLTSCQSRSFGRDPGEQLQREQFGEQEEIALVVRSHVDEELALFGEFVESCQRPHLILNHGQPYGLDHMVIAPLRARTIIQIRPFQERRVAAGV